MRALSPTLAHILTPDAATLRFAIKGVLSMALALSVSLYMHLDRPYWALVSAVFLQMRPESGMVIEKALCQILGSVAGGVFAIVILDCFMPYPLLALGCLALWIGANAAASAMMHSMNFIYAFAMAAMTASLVVALVMANGSAADSATVFDVAQARISEISVGAICATLVSLLIWPVRVKDTIRGHARNLINQTLSYLVVELDPNGTHSQRHAHADSILAALIALNDDSSAVVYEGPEGPGRARAAHLLCNKVMALLSVIQIFGRFQRNHPELLSGNVSALLADMRRAFEQMVATTNYTDCLALAQTLRREIQQFRSDCGQCSPIQSRLLQTATELMADLVIMLNAYDALENQRTKLLKAKRLSTYRDPLLGAITGFRSMLVFIIGAGIWIGSAAPAAVMMMVLPVTFSVMFARLPSPPMALKRMLVGVIVAIPIALFFALGLLAQSSGDLELLLLIMAAPFFVGLLVLSNRATLPYGLGFCIVFTTLVQPSNGMTFSVGTTLSTAMGILVGISILYWVFKMITAPDSLVMQRRLIRSTARDLAELQYQPNGEYWFNGRMGERLLRLSEYERGSGSTTRYMTDLGLTGLNMGHISVRVKRIFEKREYAAIQVVVENWQHALANAYWEIANGHLSQYFRDQCNVLIKAAIAAGMEETQAAQMEGMFERLQLTFERTAKQFSPEAPVTEILPIA